MSQYRRITTTITVSGQTQSGSLTPIIGEIDHLILTSDQENHSFDLSLINEKNDVIWGPRNVTLPQNEIRPGLHYPGALVIKVENPLPASGTITVVAIAETN